MHYLWIAATRLVGPVLFWFLIVTSKAVAFFLFNFPTVTGLDWPHLWPVQIKFQPRVTAKWLLVTQSFLYVIRFLGATHFRIFLIIDHFSQVACAHWSQLGEMICNYYASEYIQLWAGNPVKSHSNTLRCVAWSFLHMPDLGFRTHAFRDLRLISYHMNCASDYAPK